MGETVQPVTVHVAAAPSSLPVLRAVVAAIAAAADLTIDEIDDAMIAVEEAALLVLGHTSTELTFVAGASDGSVDMFVSGDDTKGTWSAKDLESSLAFRILSGVVTNLSIDADRPGLQFSKRSATS